MNRKNRVAEARPQHTIEWLDWPYYMAYDQIALCHRWTGPMKAVAWNIYIHTQKNPGHPRYGRAWTSQETIARETGLSASTVYRAFKALVEDGQVGVERIRTGKGKADQYNEYWLVFTETEAQATVAPGASHTPAMPVHEAQVAVTAAEVSTSHGETSTSHHETSTSHGDVSAPVMVTKELLNLNFQGNHQRTINGVIDYVHLPEATPTATRQAAQVAVTAAAAQVAVTAAAAQVAVTAAATRVAVTPVPEARHEKPLRPYGCYVCGQTFTKKADRDNHLADCEVPVAADGD